MDNRKVTKPGETPEKKPPHDSVNRAAALEKAATAHAIIPALQDKDGWIRGNAAEALVKIGIPAVPSLLQAMQDANKDVRRGVAEVLGKIGEPSAVAVLIDALRDENEKVRRNCAIALGQIAETTAVPPLIEALRDPDWHVREHVAEALGRIGDVSAVPALLPALNDRESDVRYTIEEALGKIGDAHTLPRKILADARLSPGERIEVLKRLRRVRYQKSDQSFRYTFPDTRLLCQAVLNEDNAEARAGAQALLKWLDEGDILVRPSQRDSTNEPQELLRAAHGETLQSQSESLLRGADDPQ